MNLDAEALPGSFRDPAGFVYRRSGTLLRHVRAEYREHYEALMKSGLYDALVARGALVAHEEIEPESGAWKTLKPAVVPFVSHPYEWCFGQLREAALLVLGIQESALERGMTLKDASAYNVQFRGALPVFIDTLSFERRGEGPWIAYRQFCEHFLAPLALMSAVDARLGALQRAFLDGVPLDLAAGMLPRRSLLRPGLLLHLHLHAKSQRAFARRPGAGSELRMSPAALRGLVESLRGAVLSLRPPAKATAWGDYHRTHNYSAEAREGKAAVVEGMLRRTGAKTLWDLGANDGFFSRLATRQDMTVIAFDQDPVAVEANHRLALGERDARMLPLLMDLANPSPFQGWAHEERGSLASRGPADAVMALALIHHLAIAHNIPLPRIADFFADLGRSLLIEFVPRNDAQVEKLLAARPRSAPDYAEEAFVAAFSRRFRIAEKQAIPGSERILYRMERLPA